MSHKSALLRSGHIPARFAIKKGRLLFLKTILEEKEDSTIQRFLMLQFENPSKGDWASSCMQDLKDLEINLSLKEIRVISKYKGADQGFLLPNGSNCEPPGESGRGF